ncbi:hypothetical protein CASFOL_018629 [Castilleja foliolosa]|uniref:Uncharacterized protein n=1 Tax=Castilleja foliolosa TaxID=1961234 RepID=A0ABD3D5A1_9LAMI
MGACASKFKDFKDDILPPAEKEAAAAPRDVKIVEATDEAAAVEEVKVVEETVSKDEVPAEAVAEGEDKPRSLGHFLKEVEGENGLATSPERVADAEAKAEIEKASPATLDEGKKAEEDIKPDNVNVGVEASEKKTEDESLAETEKIEILEKCEEHKSLAETEKIETLEKCEEQKSLAETETEKIETLEKCEEQKIGSVGENEKAEGETTKPETQEANNETAEHTKIETPDDDKQVVEPTKTDNPVVKTDEKKPVSDAAENPIDVEEKTNN